MLGPGLASSSVSSGVSPISPIRSPPTSTTVAGISTPASDGSREISALASRIGNPTASIRPRNTSGPSSNSWLPTVIAS